MTTPRTTEFIPDSPECDDSPPDHTCEAENSPMAHLIHKLATKASKRGLRRMGTHVFAPHANVPGALVRGQLHKDFINATLREDPVFHKGVFITKLQKWFEEQDHHRFPILQDVSRTAIAFRDGWLDAATGDWHEDDAPPTLHFFDVCAEPAETPLWDKLIKTQLCQAPDKLQRFDAFQALIGRLFVPAGLDNWQLVLFLIGEGDKGKGTVVKVVQSMLPAGSVAAFSSSRQKSFALQDVVTKRLVVFPDVAKDIEKSLPADVWRSMVSAESVAINGKYQSTFTEDWPVPMLMAANEFPSYDDKGGRLSRRLAVFVFDTPFEVDTRLSEKIRAELPAILLRCVRAYHDLRREAGDRSLRDVLPAGVLPSMRDVEIARNPLAAFIAKGDNVYTVQRESEMPLSELQDAFEDHIQRNNLRAEWTDHRNVLDILPGISVRKVHACKKCGKRASKESCGQHYSVTKRAKKQFVVGIHLVRKRCRQR